MKIFLIAGARPNFMKIAPIVRALGDPQITQIFTDYYISMNFNLRKSAKSADQIEWKIVHTGQHSDYEMSQAFFDDLELPESDYYLDAGSGSHAVQTA